MAFGSRLPALAAAALAAGALAAATPAGAAVKRFYPMQFLEKTTWQGSFRSPANIGVGTGGAGEFWVPFKLPDGAIVTGLAYYHSGAGTGTPRTTVSLDFKGNEGVQYDPRYVVEGSHTGVTGGATVAVIGTLNASDPAVWTYRSNRRYWINVFCEDGGAVWEVDVSYQLP